jgi:hypothetical protein
MVFIVESSGIICITIAYFTVILANLAFVNIVVASEFKSDPTN